MTIDDRQELGSLYWCMGESPHARASAAQPRATGTTEKTRAEGTAGPPTIATVVHTQAGCGDDSMATNQSRPILLQDDRSGVREDFGRRPRHPSASTVTTRRPSILHPFLIYHRQTWPHRIAVVVLSLCHHHDCRAVPRPHNRFGPPSSTPRVSRECLRRLARTWYGDLDPKSEKIEDVTPFVDASTNLMPFLDTASLITTRSVLGSSPASTPRRRPSTPPEVDESPGLDSSKVLPLVNKIGLETTSQRTTDIRRRHEAWVQAKGAHAVDSFTAAMEFWSKFAGRLREATGQLTKKIRESYEAWVQAKGLMYVTNKFETAIEFMSNYASGAVDESEPTSERGLSVGDLSGDESSDEGVPRPKRAPLKMAESPSSTKSSNSGDSNGSESEDEMDSPPSVKKRSSDLPSKPKAPNRRKN
ncbi:hypothetical protein THAOC_26561 [Thalassiosira oceanica]|uniref:Uncharacterized protein n=1 Tax=Thalassiosira oceanica TaxID=159749 RepID=K0RYH8_THAOC|nr:hypothetical protein THAOC_26561 [Thalassiosira oceanica]|eukprot:EJK53911.1 hypothetical protein THAOC_26561 [Thalassiosira oceanica]